jgi:hypothetical protein
LDNNSWLGVSLPSRPAVRPGAPSLASKACDDGEIPHDPEELLPHQIIC